MTGKMLVIGLVSVTLGCAFTAAARSVPTPLVTSISVDPAQRAVDIGRSQRFAAIATFAADLPRALSSTPIAAGGDHSCALLVDGTVDCWGRNASGQLGNGTTGASINLPGAVSGIFDAMAPVSWSRSDPLVAGIDAYGNAAGRTEGTVAITAIAVNFGKMGVATLTVPEPDAALATCAALLALALLSAPRARSRAMRASR
jgi:hypothetical protein